MSDSSPSSHQQASIVPFHDLNRYDERHEDWRSDAVYGKPQRTLRNGWRKFHAARDCGAQNVSFVENSNHHTTTNRHEYDLRCWACGHRIDEDEVLFIGGKWYRETGWEAHGTTLDNLWLPKERILELGPDPDEEDLIQALDLTRIERSTSILGVTFGTEQYYECDDCEKETFLTYDGKCRMCYSGEWTDRMQQTLTTVKTSILKRNGSFKHQLENHIDPLSTKGRAYSGTILWRRRSDNDDLPKLVEIAQCLKDDDDGHWEYVLTNLEGTDEWRFHEDRLAEAFWDTSLRNQDGGDALDDECIQQAYQYVRDE